MEDNKEIKKLGRPPGSKNKNYNKYILSLYNINSNDWATHQDVLTIPEISDKIGLSCEIIRNLIFYKSRCRDIYKKLYKIEKVTENKI